MDEPKSTSLGIRAVVFAHDLLDGLGSLIGIIERDRGNVVVSNMGLDNTVKQMTADESKFTINGCCGATNVVPAFRVVVGKCRIGVLEESDGN